jgi:hypothetical protein
MGAAPPPYAPPGGYPAPRRGTGVRTLGIIGAIAVAVVVVLVAIVAVLGTKQSPPKEPGPGTAVASPSSSGTPVGYRTFSDRAARFSIAVPSDWRSVDPTSPGAAAAIQQLQQTNPNFRRAFSGNLSNLLANDVKFLAISPVSQGTEAPNINVIVKPAPGFVDADLGQIRNALPAEYAKIGATLVGITNVTLDGHEALRTSATLPINTGLGSTVVASQAQYIVGGNDFVYIITLTGTSPELPTIATTFQIN